MSPVAERPITGIERVMLRFGPTMGADLVVGRVAGELAPASFRAAAAAVVRRHPMLRVRVLGEPPARFVVAAPEEAPVDVEIVAAQDEQSWQPIATRETARPFALDGGPACRFLLVAGEGVAHVIVSAPHAIVDGRSLLRLLDDVLTAWRGEALDRASLPVTPAAMSLIRRPLLYRLGAPLLKRAWISGLRAHQRRPPLRPRAAATADADVTTLTTFREGTRAGWEALRRACTDHQVTVGGALLAATWFALARLIATDTGTIPRRLTLDLDVDLRARVTPPAPDTHVAFYTGVAPLGGRVRPTTDFWALARRLRGQTVRALRWGVPELVHLLPEGIDDYFEHVEARGVDRYAAGGTGSLVAVSNVGRYPHATDHGALRLTGLWGFNGACLLGPALIGWLRFVDGHLFYNAIGGTPAVDQPLLERFQDAIFDLLEAPRAALSLAAWCAAPEDVDDE